MTTIYLIRHAEAEGNLYRIAQGQANSIITDRGWRQIQALERRFADIPVDAVDASDLYRTCATASAIYKPKGLPLHRRRDLREICVGVWEEKTWGEIAREDPEQLRNFNSALHLWHAEGAETPQAVQSRLLAAVRDIAAANAGKTVAVFSHGCALRLLLAALQGIPLEELGRTPTVKKRANGLEPGLYFRPLEPAQAGFPAECAGRAPEGSLDGAPALVGYLEETPVGAVAFDDRREADRGCGWISLLAVAEPWRRRGYGVQLIGQAVLHYRPKGRDRLRLPPPETEAAEGFYREFGFAPALEGDAWEKSIGYDPEFLGA